MCRLEEGDVCVMCDVCVCVCVCVCRLEEGDVCVCYVCVG